MKASRLLAKSTEYLLLLSYSLVRQRSYYYCSSFSPTTATFSSIMRVSTRASSSSSSAVVVAATAKRRLSSPITSSLSSSSSLYAIIGRDKNVTKVTISLNNDILPNNTTTKRKSRTSRSRTIKSSNNEEETIQSDSKKERLTKPSPQKKTATITNTQSLSSSSSSLYASIGKGKKLMKVTISLDDDVFTNTTKRVRRSHSSTTKGGDNKEGPKKKILTKPLPRKKTTTSNKRKTTTTATTTTTKKKTTTTSNNNNNKETEAPRSSSIDIIQKRQPRKKRVVVTKVPNSSSSAEIEKDQPRTKRAPRQTTPSSKTKPKTTKTKTKTKRTSATIRNDDNDDDDGSGPLLTLPSDCIEAQFLCRPSKRNRSPYVADIFVPSLGREAICHVPNLDMGGKCRAGVTLLVKPQRDKKGNLLGPNAVNPKYNTPKCEFIAQLLHVDESKLSSHYTPTWVGAHPSLGETIAKEIIRRHISGSHSIPGIPPIIDVKEQVMIREGTRSDFVLEGSDGRKRIVEVKTVVDTDYCATYPIPKNVKCVFTSVQQPYRRVGIFPWGESKQKGPNGETVVSARAIKHVRELTDIVSKGENDATILFVVIRGDAVAFRPNGEACPSFARYLKDAEVRGVQILVKRVRWGSGVKDRGEDDAQMRECLDDGWLDVEWS